MKKMFVWIGLAAILLTGCATAGNDALRKESKVSIDQKLIDHQTTQSEVKAMLGAPMGTSFTDGGNVIWTYELTHMSADASSYIPVVSLFAGSSSGTKKTLTILFDSKNVVAKHQMTESDVKVRTGLFNQ
ncbi:hypothetical protein [Mariprofundus ferrooxydans]|uniref:hypothetical protein n=1 Tax=Mariprofundus ferrooxydans TaxID=314344 RepID=UPI0014322E1C|nr:hypothetical protein [Mariprofundus ferrooxydans]